MGSTLRICCLLAALSCSTAESRLQAPAIEDFYCENSYTNFAWGYQHRGRYVDGQGRVFAFGGESSSSSVAPWAPSRPETPTQQELEQKYSHNRRQVGTVDAKDLTRVRRWLAEARHGSLSKKVQRGADRGASSRACWIRGAGSDRYQQVELDVTGDWTYTNSAPAAGELVRWLVSVTKKEEG
jgi:hypothetical protein